MSAVAHAATAIVTLEATGKHDPLIDRAPTQSGRGSARAWREPTCLLCCLAFSLFLHHSHQPPSHRLTTTSALHHETRLLTVHQSLTHAPVLPLLRLRSPTSCDALHPRQRPLCLHCARHLQSRLTVQKEALIPLRLSFRLFDFNARSPQPDLEATPPKTLQHVQQDGAQPGRDPEDQQEHDRSPWPRWSSYQCCPPCCYCCARRRCRQVH